VGGAAPARRRAARRWPPPADGARAGVVVLFRAGLTNAEIAVRLSIAPGTVRRRLENVYGKLGVHTRTAALAKLRLA